MYITRELRGHG